MTSPDFTMSPMPPCWSLLAYGGQDRNGFDQQPIEYNYTTPKGRAAIIERARFEADYEGRSHVKVRDADGAIIYDGPAWEPHPRAAESYIPARPM